MEVNDKVSGKPLRWGPGLVIIALQWLFWYIIPALVPEFVIWGAMAGILGGLAVVIWWAFFSRAPRIERWTALILMAIALYVTSMLIHVSIATANVGLMFILYSIPAMSFAFVIWAVATRNLSDILRRVTMILTILLASGFWIFLRTDGMDGDGNQDLNWRWAETPEDRLLAQSGDESSMLPSTPAETDSVAVWPGFRGPGRDGVIRGMKIKTDWSTSPPVELWRRPVGPGCSSFAVRLNLLYTQEQRGEYEMVSCYELTTGKPVWKHSDKARFYDSHAGAGPRSTPTLFGSCVYTLGATGILNALDAANGSVKWSRNAASDAGVQVLTWGFSGSPLVTGDLVIVAVSGKLAAYDTGTGNPRWFGPDGGSSYSSPHLLTICGIPQVLLMNDTGAVSIEPATGKQLWQYSWKTEGRILQPALLENGDLLLVREMIDVRRVTVSQGPAGWTIKERWTSSKMKLNFNDIVIHKGYAYGFDEPSLACINTADGKRKWKGNRYRGWLLLLADQDLLLVLSEKGELALVPAVPDRFTELSRFPAIKGKTWNHPALAGDVIIVRNSQEMAAFRLPRLNNP